MPIRIHSVIRPQTVGALSWQFTDATGTFSGSLTGTYAHEAGTVTSAAIDAASLASALQSAMDAATAAVVTVSYNTATYAYTITSNSASFSLDFTGARAVLGRALGFSTTAALTGSLSYTSTVRPTHVIVPALDALVGDPFPYDEEDQITTAIADDGVSYANGPTSLIARRDWAHQFEPKAAVFQRQASASVPWTWDQFFRFHAIWQAPFLVFGTSDGNWACRPIATEFSRSLRAMAQSTLDSHWTINVSARFWQLSDVTLPVNTVAPVISGTVGIGNVLTSTTGTWTGSPSFTYQWQQRTVGGTWSDTATATGSSRTLTAAEVYVRLRVRGTNGAGSVDAFSNELSMTASSAVGAKLGWLLDERGQSGSPIDTWTDQSATAANVTAAGAQRPATGTTINGFAAPLYDGTDDQGSTGSKYWTDVASTTGSDVMIICRPTSASATTGNSYTDPCVLSVNGAHVQVGFTTTGFRAQYSDGAFKTSGPIAAATAANHVVSVRHDGSNLTLAVNATVASSVACGTITGTSVNAFVGRNYNGTAFFAGAIAFVLTTKSALTTTERANLYAFLAWKYGVTTP